MLHTSQKTNNLKNRLINPKIHNLDHASWQQFKQKVKLASALPPIRETSSHRKTTTKVPLGGTQTGLSIKSTKRGTKKQPEVSKERFDATKMQSKVRLIRSLLRNRRATLLEHRNHEYLLTKLNRDLVNIIRRQEENSAQKVEAMLQQQKIVKTIIDVLEYVHKKKLQDLQGELQKREEEEERKVNRLGQLVEELTANLQKTHKQVSFLSTYMDHEYPIKSIQIGTLVRQLQQMKDSQQEDLEDLREMQSKVLQSLYDQMHKKRENLLHSLVMKTLYPYQESLLQKTKETQRFLSYQEKFRESIGELEEEIPKLRAEVVQLQQYNLEPREVLFPDILLRRPKCTPDMDVVLNIPMEEELPF